MASAPLRDPWLVAAWPGMGAVALGAVTHLLEQLDTEGVAELDPRGYFEISQITVKEGLILSPSAPKNVLSLWRNPTPAGRDLLFFVGEVQPTLKGYEFCRALIDAALPWRVRRVCTFAAMGTPTHPKADARVFAGATHADLLAELEPQGVVLLQEGEITGLNGILLAAAMERGLDGFCLLGEFPYFASSIRNPKASSAVLRCFAEVASIDVDLEALDTEAQEVEQGLTQLLERLQQGGGVQPVSPADFSAEQTFSATQDGDEDEKPSLAAEDRRQIERLFRAAMKDRHEALKLKAELDRLGVFKEYEDRFLDLFKRGG